jgi:predicted RNA-binding Zn ribbon-like protein
MPLSNRRRRLKPIVRTDWDSVEFTKTRGWEARDRTDDEFVSYDGLMAWCERRKLISARQGREYRKRASERPAEARAAVTEAQSLRTLIYEVLSALGHQKLPSEGQLRQVSEWVRRSATARRLARSAEGIRWEWHFDRYRLDHPLAPIAWSLGDLLAAPERVRVRVCDADDCGWLFVDGSRGRSRRWCDTADCGNLARVRRFRSRESGQ